MPELSTAPSDSAVTGAEKLLTLGFENVTVQQVADANESKSADIASAATTDLSTVTTPYVHVTGTTTITGLGTIQAGTERLVVFDGALLLTHNATSLILPTGANITTAAGDAAIFRSEGSGNWRCVAYQRADGTPLAGGGGSYTGTAGSITLTGSAFSIDATYVGQTSITTLGTIATGTWNATAISAVKGGTGQTGYAVGDLLYASSTTALSKLAVGTDGYVLTLASGVPTWAAASGGGGSLTGFTATLETASPNNTINASRLLASGGTTNQDAVLQPKGSGALVGRLADGSTNGNKRGTNAVDWSQTRTGATRVASGASSTISGGHDHIANAQYSSVLGGNNCEASGIGATAVGQNNIADGEDSYAIGNSSRTRGIKGSTARASGTFLNIGEAQTQSYVLRASTTNATQTTLTTDAAAAGTTNQVRLSANYMWAVVKGTVHGAEKATGDAAAWEFTAFIQRYSTTTMVVTCTPTLIGAAAGASAWALAVDADTTNHALRIRVTGEAAKTIRWLCDVYSCSQIGWT